MNLFFWKHNKDKKNPVVINKKDFEKLPSKSKVHFHPTTAHTEETHMVVINNPSGYANGPDDFALSMLAAEATGNATLGYIAGGNLAGAMVGEMLTEQQEHSRQVDEQYGGMAGDVNGGTINEGNDPIRMVSDPVPDTTLPDQTPDPVYEAPEPDPVYDAPDTNVGSDTTDFGGGTSDGGGDW